MNMEKNGYVPYYDIEYAKGTIGRILSDTREFDDWTQISLSLQDAVCEIEKVYGSVTEEECDKLMRVIVGLSHKEMDNILFKYDITFKKK